MGEATCIVDGCVRPVLVKKRGLCKLHYERWARARPASERGPRRKPIRYCSVEGCERVATGRGWCDMHHTRWKRHGDPLGWGFAPESERFWAKVDKDGPTPQHRPDLGPCWVWTAARQRRGYGLFAHADGGLAHRYAYTQMVGVIPAGLELDHVCRNTSCVRPSHLEPVPHRVNVLRGKVTNYREAPKAPNTR